MADAHYTPTLTKVCRSCGETKEFSLFPKDPHCKFGVSTRCFVCEKAYRREYYKKHKQRFNEKNKERSRRITAAYDPSRVPQEASCTTCKLTKPASEFNRSSSNLNGLQIYCKECKRKRDNEHRLKNVEAVREKQRQQYAKNPEPRLENRQKWYRANKDASLAISRSYKAKKREAEGSHTGEDILRLYKLQRGMCAVCFEKLSRPFHVDHRVALKNGGSNDWTNLQLLHPRCNQRKSARDPIEFMQDQGLLL